jgi:ribosome-binding factor A
MPSKRLARLNEQLKREIAQLLRTHVRDPRVGVVSVTGVEVVSDLAVAKVYVRIIGSDAERAETLEGLDAASPFLRSTLGRILHVRRVPELRFQLDRSFEHAQRIETLLSEVMPEDSDEEGEEGSESEGGPEEAEQPE